MNFLSLSLTMLLTAIVAISASAQTKNIQEDSGMIWATYPGGDKVVISQNSNMLYLVKTDECTSWNNIVITRTECDIMVTNETVKCTLDFITGDCHMEQMLRSDYRR